MYGGYEKFGKRVPSGIRVSNKTLREIPEDKWDEIMEALPPLPHGRQQWVIIARWEEAQFPGENPSYSITGKKLVVRAEGATCCRGRTCGCSYLGSCTVEPPTPKRIKLGVVAELIPHSER